MRPFKTIFTLILFTIASFAYSQKYLDGDIIFIKNKNITKLAYALGNLFKELKNEPISKEYLQLLIQLF